MSTINKDSRIYIAGHRGLIGSAFVRCLSANGYTNLIVRDHASLDLTDTYKVNALFEIERPEYVILAAGKVGGIVENKSYPAEFITQNLAIQLNVIRAAHTFGIKRLIFFCSSCMYPRDCAQPMHEKDLLSGYLEPTSMSYAIAKLAGLQMCLAYNEQFGDKRFLPVIPNSVFGENDNFDPNSSHVLSALINRFHNAKVNAAESVTLWGSGSPRREFLYADDLADACLMLLEGKLHNIELPINIGTTYDQSIMELAKLIAGVVGYSGTIEWDKDKPDGTPRKLLDSTRILNTGWSAKTPLMDGISRTYEWYLQNRA
jgi:GDP-L-fucose synthase